MYSCKKQMLFIYFIHNISLPQTTTSAGEIHIKQIKRARLCGVSFSMTDEVIYDTDNIF